MNNRKKEIIVENYKNKFNNLIGVNNKPLLKEQINNDYKTIVRNNFIDIEQPGFDVNKDVIVHWDILLKGNSSTISGFDITINKIEGSLSFEEGMFELNTFKKETIIENQIDNKSDFAPNKILIDTNKKLIKVIF